LACLALTQQRVELCDAMLRVRKEVRLHLPSAARRFGSLIAVQRSVQMTTTPTHTLLAYRC